VRDDIDYQPVAVETEVGHLQPQQGADGAVGSVAADGVCRAEDVKDSRRRL
jgi:hypothetical protein